MFVGSDGCTTNAEHQWQQRQNIYVVHGPIAVPAMFGAWAADVW
jgi:hypothetical protein